MNVLMNVLVLIFIFIGLTSVGIPISFALLAASIGSFLISGISIPFVALAQRMTHGLDNFVLLAIPLFLLAGNMMNRFGIAKRIFELVLNSMGHVKGALAYVNIVASTIFAGMSGVAQADVAGLGIVEMEAMDKDGYDVDFSAAITAASSTIGPVIPPSITMVIYAFSAGNVSVGRLFLAGFIPGIMMALFLMVTVFYLINKGKIKSGNIRKKAKTMTILKNIRNELPCLMAPTILILGMVLGIATPTELGAITVVYVLFLGLIYRELTIDRLFQSLIDTVITIGVLIFIISCAFTFGLNITLLQIPNLMTEFVLSIASTKEAILAIVVIIFLVLGTFMESTTILILFTPILVPLVKAMGINLVHFGMIEVLAVLIGALTPPFGICLYIVGHIGNVSIWKVSKALIPFYIALGVCLLLIMYIPRISLFIPDLLFK